MQSLEVFAKKPNIGLTALIEKANITNKISTYDLGFKLGPRINAGGRLGKSKHGTELLTCEDETKVADIATELDNFNKERQTIEAHILKTAIDTLTTVPLVAVTAGGLSSPSHAALSSSERNLINLSPNFATFQPIP